MKTEPLQRECPNCHSTITYKLYHSLLRAARLNSICIECRHAKHRLSPEQKLARRDEIQEWQRIYRERNVKQLTHHKKEALLKKKRAGIAFYGGACKCCGETIEEFLTLEHKGGRNETDFYSGGTKKITGKRAWEKACSQGWPDRYTVLCFNCNCARGHLGYCPHEKLK